MQVKRVKSESSKDRPKWVIDNIASCSRILIMGTQERLGVNIHVDQVSFPFYIIFTPMRNIASIIS